MLSSSSFDSNFFTVSPISPSYKPLSLTLLFSELQTPRKQFYKNPPKKIHDFSELSGPKQRTHISFGKAYKTDRILKARSGIDFCKLKKTSKSLLQTFKELLFGPLTRSSPREENSNPRKKGSTSANSQFAHTHTQFATSKQKFFVHKKPNKASDPKQTRLPTCPKTHTQSKEITRHPIQETRSSTKRRAPPDPKDELFLSASWSTTDAQHKTLLKGVSNKHANP
jgi:hypothetical protein